VNVTTMEKRRPVVVESPFAGDIHKNVAYARRCMRDSVSRGEAPFLPHLLYTQRVDGDGWAAEKKDSSDPGHWVSRRVGLEMAEAWRAVADATILYLDLGKTSGMALAETEALASGQKVEYRYLD